MIDTNNYGGLDAGYTGLDQAKVVVIPVPYDETSTWGKGADKGPDAILEASANMELYDIETDSEVYKTGIYTAPPVTEKSSP
jgi:agmatinase